MNKSNSDARTDSSHNKEFWDSLHLEILKSNKELSSENIFSFVEKSFMFSMFFRSISHKELCVFKSILQLRESGYVIILELSPGEKTNPMLLNLDELMLFSFIKKELRDIHAAVGPVIHSRFSILITDDSETSSYDKDIRTKSIALTGRLQNLLKKEFGIELIAGIGNVQSIHSIYTSFLEALSCMYHCNPGEIIHVQDIGKDKKMDIYEYKEAENHMIDAIRSGKPDAYDYFVLMMNRIKQLNDNAKRNRIAEALVLAAYASRIEGVEENDIFNYTGNINFLIELKGDQLIEWALQRFVDITGHVKPHSAIDYSNKIVQATKEYLEAHYAEEISLEDAADYVNISPQYFSKLIKKNTGFNFIDWLSMLRVKKAKELLSNSNLTVKEVCFMVGYKDPNYFSRIFKKRIGMTPSEYIKKKNFN